MVHVVMPAPITLSQFRRVPPGGFQLSYSANPGLLYYLQRSSDLLTWQAIATNQATSNPSLFLDNTASNGPNFYRVQLAPNP